MIREKKIFKDQRIPFKSIILYGFLPSFLKKIIYRLKGYRIGKNVKFSPGSIIIARNSCKIGNHVSFGFLSIINVNDIEIGDYSEIRSFTFIKSNKVIIGNDITISENVAIRAGHPSHMSNIAIGDRTHIFPYSIIDPSYPINIGKEACVGFYTDIYTHGAFKNVLDGYGVDYGEVNIGDKVELTYKVFVAPGVTIGEDAQIAYGSFVNQDIPPRVLAAGTPAKVRRTKEQFAPEPSEKKKLEIIEDIISTFYEYLHYHVSIKVERKSKDNWIISHTKFRYKIILLKKFEYRDYFDENCIVITMTEVPDKYLPLLKQNKFIIFDIQNQYSNSRSNFFGNELRKHFKKYGIRFKDNLNN